MNTAIILLAAGGSHRLGRPKQLVDWQGQPLLRHAAISAIAAGLGGSIVVVLGAVDEPCREALAGLDLVFATNSQWDRGMGGSIATGMRALESERPDGVIVMLCDQPLVTSQLLRALAEKSSAHPIVTSHYHGQPGPPAWFAPRYFERLAKLYGNQGAKSLILSEPDRAQIVVPEAGLDIDLPEDLDAAENLIGWEEQTRLRMRS